MSEFETNLWREVMHEHGEDLARAARPMVKARWGARPRLLAGTTAGLAAAGASTALLLGATASSPAFAVTRNANGTVTVKLIRLSGISGANRALAAMGVRAKIATVDARYVARARLCPPRPAVAVRTLRLSTTTRIPQRTVVLVPVARAPRPLRLTSVAPVPASQLSLERSLAKQARDLAPVRMSRVKAAAGNATRVRLPDTLWVYCGGATVPASKLLSGH
jgi:hypothetical protein